MFYAGEIKKLEIKLEDNIPYLYGTAIIKISNSISPFVVDVYQVNFKTKKPFEVKISDLDECTIINLTDIEYISYNFIEFEEVRNNDEDNSISTGEIWQELIEHWLLGIPDGVTYNIPIDKTFPNTLKEIKDIIIDELKDECDIYNLVNNLDDISVEDFPNIVSPYIKEYTPHFLRYNLDDFISIKYDLIEAIIKDCKNLSPNFYIKLEEEVNIYIYWTEQEIEDNSEEEIVFIGSL